MLKAFTLTSGDSANISIFIHTPLTKAWDIHSMQKTFTLTGGDSASIADLLCAATLDQTKEAGASVSHINLDKRRHKR